MITAIFVAIGIAATIGLVIALIQLLFPDYDEG